MRLDYVINNYFKIGENAMYSMRHVLGKIASKHFHLLHCLHVYVATLASSSHFLKELDMNLTVQIDIER